jgi:O-methyltransferase involved in polyketide biosynthesis
MFVLEGLTMYLTEEVVRRQFAALAERSAAGSRLTTDFYPSRATTAADRKRLRVQRLARAGSRESLHLGVTRDQAISLVEACGWHVDEAVPAREAARALVPRASGLPVDGVSEDGTFLAASR